MQKYLLFWGLVMSFCLPMLASAKTYRCAYSCTYMEKNPPSNGWIDEVCVQKKGNKFRAVNIRFSRDFNCNVDKTATVTRWKKSTRKKEERALRKNCFRGNKKRFRKGGIVKTFVGRNLCGKSKKIRKKSKKKYRKTRKPKTIFEQIFGGFN